jgi:hypothetical protein
MIIARVLAGAASIGGGDRGDDTPSLPRIWTKEQLGAQIQKGHRRHGHGEDELTHRLVPLPDQPQLRLWIGQV